MVDRPATASTLCTVSSGQSFLTSLLPTAVGNATKVFDVDSALTDTAVSGAYIDEIFFRYSDAFLMKAEAMMRSGQDITAMVNQLRTLRNASALASVSEQDLLDERGRELYAEFWRRNDMIRFGQYTRNWEFKDPSAVGDVSKNVFPIPDSQLILNPNLVQNPGY